MYYFNIFLFIHCTFSCVWHLFTLIICTQKQENKEIDPLSNDMENQKVLFEKKNVVKEKDHKICYGI